MNPIATAVAPVKADAITRAGQDARKMLDNMLAKLETADWNLDVVAPRPGSHESRPAYMMKKNLRAAFALITETDSRGKLSLGMLDPVFVKRAPDREAAAIKQAQEEAAIQYDAFVAKLQAKIGEVKDAKLDGNHVWGYSILTVTLPGGEIEKWKTQQIMNVSVLGKLFNQWPTRKVGSAGKRGRYR